MSILAGSLLQVDLSPYDVWVDTIVIVLLLVAIFLYFFRGGWSRGRVTEKERVVAPMPTAPPLAVRTLASASSGEVPFVVNFRSSAYGGKPPYKYRWDFGDGGSSEEPQPQHRYDMPGGFVASLTITDANGVQKKSETMGITAIAAPMPPPPPPITAAIMSSATEGVAPLAVSFRPSAQGGKPPYKFLWEFDDGTTSEEMEPQHTYVAKGVYLPRLTLSDSDGAEARKFDGSKITVAAPAKPPAPKLVGGITASVAEGEAPLTVEFKATASGGAPPYAYHWDFDDGTTSREPGPKHTFENRGIYRPILVIKDKDGTEEKVNGSNIQVAAARLLPPPERPHAYCVKCQKKREIQDPVWANWQSTNREILRGKCPVCGTGLYRIVGKTGNPLPKMSSLK